LNRTLLTPNLLDLLKRTESSSWAWLGSQKIGNTWTWIDRTSWDYTNWSHSEPNPGGPCLHNRIFSEDGSWDNKGCSGKYWKRLYVCEKPSGMKNGFFVNYLSFFSKKNLKSLTNIIIKI
jgi:hypothetical protein